MNDLNELVFSLSAKEKNYISKQFSNKNGKMKRLFILLCKEKAIQKKQQGVPEIRFLLYRFILTQLTRLYSSSHAFTSLKNAIIKIDLLLNRNLIHQAKKLLKKAKKIAQKHELFYDEMILLDMESQVNIRLGLFSKNKDVAIQKQKLIKIESEVQQLNDITLQLYDIIIEKGGYIDGSSKSKINSLLQLELNKALQDFNSEKSRQLFLYAKSFAYWLIKEMDESFNSRLTLVQLIKKHKPFVENNPNIYLSALQNLANELYEYDKLKDINKEFKYLFKKYEHSYFKHTADLAKECYITNYLTEIILSGKKDILKKGCLELQIEHNIRTKSLTIFSQHEIWFKLAVMFFYLGNFKESLYYQYKVLSEESLRLDISVSNRLLGILIHLIQGNFELVESQVRSARRYFKNNHIFNHLEKFILSKALNVSQKIDRKKVSSTILSHIQSYITAEIKSNSNSLLFINPILWKKYNLVS